MSRNLDEIIDILSKNFDKTARRQAQYEDQDYAGASTPSNFAIANRQALGAIGGALVEALKLQDQRNAGNGAASKLKGLGKS